MTELGKIYSSEDVDVEVTSSTIELGRYFTDRGARSQLLVLVEDKEDEPFWRLMFSCISSSYASIDVWTLQKASAHSMTQYNANEIPLLATGKDALMSVKNLGKNKVVAVDQDWDGLVPGHKYAERLLKDPYVVSTLYYAIENHLCTAEAVSNYYLKITGQDLSISYVAVLDAYNGCLDPILLYLMAEDEYSLEKSIPHAFSISELRKYLKQIAPKVSPDFVQTFNEQVRNDYGRKMDAKKIDIDAWRENLRAQNLYPNDLWKIVQGHTLHDFAECWLHEQVFKELNRRMATLDPQQRSSLVDSFRSKYKSIANRVWAIFYDEPYVDFNNKDIKKIQERIKLIPSLA